MVTHRQRYREKVSQMVSWGHWFALFNILLSLVIGSRYLFIADWPTTLAGRIYSYVSIIGHFSFLVFATYLLILFPRRRRFARPLAAFLFIAFIASHVVYIWADANFYRPITMQRANLPLSYPMTARRFLEKHGLLDAQEYQRRLIEQGNPDAVSVQYPLSELRYR